MATRDDELAPLDRLVDQPRGRSEGAPWVHARAVELVQCMDPLRLSIGGKQRLLLSLGHGWVRRRAAWLRPVIVGLLVIGGGAIASAALTNWPARLVRSYRTLISERVDATSPARPPVARSLATTELPATDPIPSAAPRPPVVVRRASVEAHGRRPLLGPSGEDPSLLIEATRALRVDRDAKRARTLAGRYLEQHPDGALADEALAISIEAAVDHHDPDARALSARYLALFPRGSFRGLAKRTLTHDQVPTSR